MTLEETQLFNRLKEDPRLHFNEEVCYILATVKHETSNTFKPLEEYGKGKGRAYGNEINGVVYYGRGFVQITWFANYKKFEKILNVPLTTNPELACTTDVAYEIMVIGMLNGLFTGRRLSDYITEDNVDYLNARRIINGTDKAQLIASYAEQYEKLF